jgi:hypothetical protein
MSTLVNWSQVRYHLKALSKCSSMIYNMYAVSFILLAVRVPELCCPNRASKNAHFWATKYYTLESRSILQPSRPAMIYTFLNTILQGLSNYVRLVLWRDSDFCWWPVGAKTPAAPLLGDSLICNIVWGHAIATPSILLESSFNVDCNGMRCEVKK